MSEDKKTNKAKKEGLKQEVEHESKNDAKQEPKQAQAEKKEKAPNDSAPNKPGARLKRAREAANLTIKDVSSYLHLNQKIIVDLENDNYDQSKGFVFIKGYIRAYANMIGESPDELIRAFDQLGLQDTAMQFTPVKDNSFQISISDTSMRWVTYMIIIGIISLFAMWWHTHHATLTNPNSKAKNAALSTTHTPTNYSGDINTEIPTSTNNATEQNNTPKPDTQVIEQVKENTDPTSTVSDPSNKKAVSPVAPLNVVQQPTAIKKKAVPQTTRRTGTSRKKSYRERKQEERNRYRRQRRRRPRSWQDPDRKRRRSNFW